MRSKEGADQRNLSLRSRGVARGYNLPAVSVRLQLVGLSPSEPYPVCPHVAQYQGARPPGRAPVLPPPVVPPAAATEAKYLGQPHQWGIAMGHWRVVDNGGRSHAFEHRGGGVLSTTVVAAAIAYWHGNGEVSAKIHAHVILAVA